MSSRLTRPQSRTPGEHRVDPSTQVYRWPELMDRLTRWATVLGFAAMAGGYLLMGGRFKTVDETAAATMGLLLVVGGAALLVGLGLTHACLAREVRFNRLYLVLRQSGRDDMVLPYSAYGDQWVVDFTRPRTLRVIVTERHRGCTILDPPEWMRVAFQEIERIQEEEGWPDPG